MNAPRLKWKATLKGDKFGEQGHLAQECLHTGSSVITHRHQTPVTNIQQANYTDPTLFPATHPTLSKTITAETQLPQS